MYLTDMSLFVSLLQIHLTDVSLFLSLLQMLIIAFNKEDFDSFTGNPAKAGSGLISVVYNLLFFCQKFIIYPDLRIASWQSGYESL